MSSHLWHEANVMDLSVESKEERSHKMNVSCGP